MAKKNLDSIPDTHEMEMLLSWYVTGSLEPELREQVDRYLAGQPKAAAWIETIENERQATIAGNNALEGPSENLLERFLARIDADEPVENAGIRPGLLEWFKAWLPTPGMPVGRLAAAAIAIVLIAQTTVIGFLVNERNDGPVYETASAPTSATPINGERLLIAFTDQATADEITKLMGEIDGSITSGPKEGGFYVVKVMGTTAVSRNIEETITTLSKRTRLIKFVARAK
ncbi:MAG: hypothetical protein GY742_14565 [Hyphomicrobiales bacterium]|nr:hypothetical protein [Hyphomicrobiales bacterium]